MTLNKEQRQSLSRRIYKELNDEYASNLKKLRIKDNHLVTIKKQGEAINKLVNKHKEFCLKNNIYNQYGNMSIPVQVSYIHKNNNIHQSSVIYDDLVLGEIDCPDLETLINKIKNKYK